MSAQQSDVEEFQLKHLGTELNNETNKIRKKIEEQEDDAC